MDTFSLRDLREHTDTLVHEAKVGKLTLVTKKGPPIFLVVPFPQELLAVGLRFVLALNLYKEGTLTTEIFFIRI